MKDRFRLGEISYNFAAIPDTVKVDAVFANGLPVRAVVTVWLTVNGTVYHQDIDQRVTTTGAGIYRILDDIELGTVPNGIRPADPRKGGCRDGLASTVRLQGGSSAVNLPPAWMDFLYNIQGKPNYQFANPRKFKPDIGYHNKGADNRAEEVAMSGNILEVLRIEGNRAYIRTYFTNQAPPALIFPDDLHPNTLIHNFSIQYPNHLDMTTDGKWARYPVIANPGEQLWIDIREIAKV